jgi:hypothetical protein
VVVRTEPLECVADRAIRLAVTVEYGVLKRIRPGIGDVLGVHELPEEVGDRIDVVEHDPEEVPLLAVEQVRHLGAMAADVLDRIAVELLEAAGLDRRRLDVQGVTGDLALQLVEELGRVRDVARRRRRHHAGDHEAIDAVDRVGEREVDDPGLSPVCVDDLPDLRGPTVARVQDVAPIARAHRAEERVHVVAAGVLPRRGARPARGRERRKRRPQRPCRTAFDDAFEVRQLTGERPRPQDAPRRAVETDHDDARTAHWRRLADASSAPR